MNEEHLSTLNPLTHSPNGDERPSYVQGALRGFALDQFSTIEQRITMNLYHAACSAADMIESSPNMVAALRKLYEAQTMLVAAHREQHLPHHLAASAYILDMAEPKAKDSVARYELEEAARRIARQFHLSNESAETLSSESVERALAHGV